jgi:hypothetical protein
VVGREREAFDNVVKQFLLVRHVTRQLPNGCQNCWAGQGSAAVEQTIWRIS